MYDFRAFHKALVAYDTAILILERYQSTGVSEFLDIVACNVQQAVELTLRGYLTVAGIEVPLTCNIDKLVLLALGNHTACTITYLA